MPPRGHGDLRDSFEVLGVGGHDNIHVLGAAHYAPSIQGKSADDDELGTGRDEAPQELVEGGLAQRRSADPVNRISL